MPTRRQDHRSDERTSASTASGRRARCGAAREPGDDAGGGAALRAGSDELDHGRNCRVLVRRRARGRPDHERHLALRRLLEPLRQDDGRLADDLLVELRQLAADRDRAVGIGRGEARQRRRQALRRFERDRRMRPGEQLLPERRPLLLGPGDVADEPVLLAGEAARDERGLDGRRPRQDRDGDPRARSRRRRASLPDR